jgi:hypothetical protein
MLLPVQDGINNVWAPARSSTERLSLRDGFLSSKCFMGLANSHFNFHHDLAQRALEWRGRGPDVALT